MFSQSSRSLEQTSLLDQPDYGGVAGGLGLQEAFTPEMREKMVKLNKENEILKRRLETETESPLGKDPHIYKHY